MKTSQLIQYGALLLLLGASAQAQIVALCDAQYPCSTNRTVTADVETQVNLTWRGLVRTNPRLAGSLSSDQGIFMLGGPDSQTVLGTINAPLTQSVGPATDDRGVAFTLNEVARVPAEVSREAVRRGARQVTYQRRFTLSGEEPVVATQTINLRQGTPGRNGSIAEGTEPSATGVTIERLSLFFERGTLTETLGPDESLTAQARIQYRGAGIINALWEVATPASTQGQPIYAPLAPVRQYLGAGREITLESPPLPNQTAGVYQVRLRFVQPGVEQEAFALTYRVSEQSLLKRRRVPVMDTLPPQSATPLSRETRFRWQPVPDSQAYQLEFYDRWPAAEPADANSDPADRQPTAFDIEPATGLVVDGRQAQAPLSASVLRHLQSDRRYYWRLIAIDAEGQVISASALEAIHTPSPTPE